MTQKTRADLISDYNANITDGGSNTASEMRTEHGNTADSAFILSTDELAAITNSTEAIQDVTGGMVTGNTETLITVTYQDGDGTLDFVVDNVLDNYNNAASKFVPSEPSGVTGADQITNMMSLTQAEYDAIGTPDASTFYVIVG